MLSSGQHQKVLYLAARKPLMKIEICDGKVDITKGDKIVFRTLGGNRVTGYVNEVGDDSSIYVSNLRNPRPNPPPTEYKPMEISDLWLLNKISQPA